MSSSKRPRKRSLSRIPRVEHSDTLWGIGDQIADYLNVTPRKAYELARLGLLPLKKWGYRTYSSTASELDKARASNPELSK
jgi:hypothetical protein